MSWQSFASFVSTLFRGPGGRAVRPVRPARPGWRPSLEMLEDRAVPSAGGLGHARLLVHAPHVHSQVGEERLEQQAERREDRLERMNHTNNPTEEKAEVRAEHREELREVKAARTTATPSAGRALGHSPHTNNGLHPGQHK